jgi:hypothetical protein
MALTKETKLLGINDLKVIRIQNDNDAGFDVASALGVASGVVDIKGIQSLSLTPKFIEKDLRGDEVVLDRYTKLDSIDFSFSNAYLSLDALSTLLGGSVVAGQEAGLKEEYVASIDTAPSAGGDITVTLAGNGSAVVYTVTILATDTRAQVAGKIANKINTQTSSPYVATTNEDNVEIVAKVVGVKTGSPSIAFATNTGSGVLTRTVVGTNSGTGETQKYTLTGNGGIAGYFVLEAQTLYSDAGDVHVRLYKCKISKFDYEMKGEDYATVSVSGMAIPSQYAFGGTTGGKIKEVTINEVATAISFNDLV